MVFPIDFPYLRGFRRQKKAEIPTYLYQNSNYFGHRAHVTLFPNSRYVILLYEIKVIRLGRCG